MATGAGVAAAGQTLMCVNLLDVLVPQFAYAGDDTLSFTWNGTSFRSADTTPVSDGAWHHVAVVFNQNYVTFYKDGVATADVFQMPAQEPSEGLLQIGTAAGSMAAFNGELYDIRVWNTARTAAQISSYRYVTLTGTEPGLKVLCSRNGVNPALPATVVNQVTGVQGNTHGNAAVVPAVLPQQPLPASVWTYQTPGESPAGPLLSPQGLLCTDNATGGSGGAFLRSVELETGQVQWSYDVRPESELASVVIPAAVGSDGQTAYIGVQSPYQDTPVNFVEIHAVSVATGSRCGSSQPTLRPRWPSPPAPTCWAGRCTRESTGVSGGGLAWGDPASGTMQVRFFAEEEQQEGQTQFMTEPVADATSVYIGRNAAADTVWACPNFGHRARGRPAAMGDQLAGDAACRHHRGPGAGLIDAVHPHRGDDRRAEHRRRVDQVVTSAQRLCGTGPAGGDRQHAVRGQHRRHLVRAGHRDR